MATKQGFAPQTVQNHFFCQMCRSPLEIAGTEALERGPNNEQRGAGMSFCNVTKGPLSCDLTSYCWPQIDFFLLALRLLQVKLHVCVDMFG